MKKILSGFLLVFLYSYSLGYTSEGYFVHRDQFYPNEVDKKKKSFYTYLHESNATQSAMIREFKLHNAEEGRNIILGSLYTFYDEEYQDIEPKQIQKVFLSGWLPIGVEKVQQYFKKEAFCLGSAYRNYPLSEKSTEIFNIKKALNKPLSEVIASKLPLHPYNYKGEYRNTFIYKLIDDFGTRGIDFDFWGGNTYTHQNHAHTEQAFLSYIENSLIEEDVFMRKDAPKSILVNMVSYLPICNTGFCLKAINSLICTENSVFKKKFIKKIAPNFYEFYSQEFQNFFQKIREENEQNKLLHKNLYEQQCENEDKKIVVENEEDKKLENKLLYKNQYEDACKKEDQQYKINYNLCEKQWNDLIGNIKLNILYTSSDLQPINPFDVLIQNNSLYKTYN